MKHYLPFHPIGIDLVVVGKIAKSKQRSFEPGTRELAILR